MGQETEEIPCSHVKLAVVMDCVKVNHKTVCVPCRRYVFSTLLDFPHGLFYSLFALGKNVTKWYPCLFKRGRLLPKYQHGVS